MKELVFKDAYAVADWLQNQISQAQAYKDTNTRLTEAHKYTQKYCMPQAWGGNVWHAILDDAIKLRKDRELAEAHAVGEADAHGQLDR